MTNAPSERGQATVEFALVLPALLLVVLAFVQLSLVVLTKFAVTHTAREVARVLVVEPGADASKVAADARPFGTGPLSVTVEWRSIDGRRTVFVRIADDVESVLSGWMQDPEMATTIAMVGE